MVPRAAQNANHPGFVARDQRYDCSQCIAWHAEQYSFPELPPGTLQAWEMYLTLQDQLRAGGLDVIGLDYTVLPAVFEIYDIPKADRRLLFEQIVVINNAVAADRSAKREAENLKRHSAQAGR